MATENGDSSFQKRQGIDELRCALKYCLPYFTTLSKEDDSYETDLKKRHIGRHGDTHTKRASIDTKQ